MRILFASSEAHPLIKTGGLADVCGSLPRALTELGHDVRLVLPAYPQALKRAGESRCVAELELPLAGKTRLLETRLPHSSIPVYLVDAPQYFARAGNPYTTAEGYDWPDNAARFALLARAAVELAQDRAGLDWRPQLVHCHDWQTGLVPALLAGEATRPATVFTIHNLSYLGLFDWADFESLQLPLELWHMDGMEFFGNFAFIKGGLNFADWLTAVSPTYAREIQTPAFGYGLEGLLRYRGDRLVGILNGVDYRVWNPATDRLIPATYASGDLAPKARDKRELQKRLGLPPRAGEPLFGFVGRLVEQKGVGLLLEALPWLMTQGVQLAVLGHGERQFEEALRRAAIQYPGQLAVQIGYDEPLAHWIEAGADIFLMPSRYEPCGLNQLYSLRYGTVPVVRATGGLADSVSDAAQAPAGQATGFVFSAAEAEALQEACQRALSLFRDNPPAWRQLMRNGMAMDFSWEHSANRYLALYRRAIDGR